MLVYVAQRWKVSAGLALWGLNVTDAVLLTSPPFSDEDFPYELLGQHDIVYIRMHGIVGQSYLYNGNWHSAFSKKKFLSVAPNMTGSKVFLEGCYGMETELPEVFLSLGVEQVVASIDTTYNSRVRVGPAGKIGQKVLAAWINGEDLSGELKSEHATFLVKDQIGEGLA
jgi:hypothetical protein